MTYQEKLRDPRWQKKRLSILSRDKWRCRFCLDDQSTLHVHHKIYHLNSDPWEHEDHELITLCEICHEGESRRKEAETLLIEATRRLDISASDLQSFACDLSALNLSHSEDVILTVLHRFMSGSITFQQQVVDLYLANQSEAKDG